MACPAGAGARQYHAAGRPGQSFVAKMTPPRAGTFIYHTHWHKDVQLAGGLYGPLIVLEPGERYDPETDHIVIIGLNGVRGRTSREPFALNGSAKPTPIVMRAGVPNRLRLINITSDNVSLMDVPCRPVRSDDVETAGEGRRHAAAAADQAPARAPACVGRRDLRLRNSAGARATVVAGSAPGPREMGVAGADQGSLGPQRIRRIVACPLRVKMRRTRTEQTSSEMRSTADIRAGE